MLPEREPSPGDILIISHWGVVYDVVRVGGDTIERTNSKQAALSVAFSAAPLDQVWFVEVGGKPVRVPCPTGEPEPHL